MKMQSAAAAAKPVRTPKRRLKKLARDVKSAWDKLVDGMQPSGNNAGALAMTICPAACPAATRPALAFSRQPAA